MSGIVRNYQKLKRLYCICIVLECINCSKYTWTVFFSHPVHVIVITDNNVVLWKSLQQFSEPTRSTFSWQTFYTIQNVEWSDALVDTNDGLQWVYSITSTPVLRRRERHNEVNSRSFNTANTALTKMTVRNTTRGQHMRTHIQQTLPQVQPAGATSSSL